MENLNPCAILALVLLALPGRAQNAPQRPSAPAGSVPVQGSRAENAVKEALNAISDWSATHPNQAFQRRAKQLQKKLKNGRLLLGPCAPNHAAETKPDWENPEDWDPRDPDNLIVLKDELFDPQGTWGPGPGPWSPVARKWLLAARLLHEQRHCEQGNDPAPPPGQEPNSDEAVSEADALLFDILFMASILPSLLEDPAYWEISRSIANQLRMVDKILRKLF